MTPKQKKTLAEQLEGNPLFNEMLESIEESALNALIYADTEQDRVEAQWRVRSVRTFRADCQEYLSSKPQRKGAIA